MGKYFLHLVLREHVVGLYTGELGIENEIANDGVIWVRERIQQEASE